MSTRALLTDREREILSGEADVTANYRATVKARARDRLRDGLPEDLSVLAEHPELFELAEAAFEGAGR